MLSRAQSLREGAMGKLIDKKRLQRAREQKQRNMRLIQKAALRAFKSFPYVDVTLESVGKLAGVPQGKTELFYHSREQLFLEVFVGEAELWYRDLAERLESGGSEMSRAEMANTLYESLDQHRPFLRLLGLLHIVLDQHLDMVDGVVFIRRLKQSMERCAAALEARGEFLGQGAGFAILNRLQNWAASLYSVSHPTGSFSMMVQDRDLVGFQVDFESELRLMIDKVLS
jgi:AcrR family transcriptional regulator